jgi:hypothetical protein
MLHSRSFLFICLFLCASAFAQDRGIIQCDDDMKQVPAWTKPGKPWVVEHLSCGQMVTVIGVGSYLSIPQYSSRPSEYVKIQIAEKVAYVDGKYVMLSGIEGGSVASKNENVSPQERSTIETEEQKKWDLITKDDVKLWDEMLVEPIYTNGPRTFAATLSNNSEFSLSHLRLLVRLYDCSGKPESDYSNCEIIGEVRPVVAISVPSGQTRRFTASLIFEGTPRVRGTFTWSYRILGVRVE